MRVEEGESGEDLDGSGGGRQGSSGDERGGGVDTTTVEVARCQGTCGGGAGARCKPDGGWGGDR
jgi:hypothetical protein